MIKYIDITENFVEKLSNIDIGFYEKPLDKYLDRENKETEIRLLFSPDFSENKYEMYFDIVEENYKIELKEMDSEICNDDLGRKIQYMKNVFNFLFFTFQSFVKNNRLDNIYLSISESNNVFPSIINVKSLYDSSKYSDFKPLGLIVKLI